MHRKENVLKKNHASFIYIYISKYIPGEMFKLSRVIVHSHAAVRGVSAA